MIFGPLPPLLQDGKCMPKQFWSSDFKLGCVVRMVVDSLLPHAKSGPNDHRKDAPPFSFLKLFFVEAENELSRDHPL